MIRKNVTGQKKKVTVSYYVFHCYHTNLEFLLRLGHASVPIYCMIYDTNHKKKEILAVVGFESTSPKRSVPFLYIKGPVCSQNYCL